MVAKYPVDIGDQEGIVDAVNYLMSGPAGLGQNFQGFSAYDPAYIRPSGRQPWSLPSDTTLDPSFYLSIPISNITIVGGNPSSLITVTFTTPFADAPFQFGDKVDMSNVVETGSDTSYNQTTWQVYDCTTTDVTLGYSGSFPIITWNTYVSGGDIGRDFLNYPTDTDCNARVTVLGPTDQVFVSAQLDLSWEYDCITPIDYSVTVLITRGVGFPNTTPGSNDFLFGDFVTISEKTFNRTASSGPNTDSLEAVFTTVLDGPNLPFNYYWYILTVKFNIPGTISSDSNFSISGTIDPITATFVGPGINGITGAGVGLTVDVDLDSAITSTYNDTNTTITVTTPGSNYAIGDQSFINGSSLGGTDPTNNMLLTFTSVGPPYSLTIGKATTGLRSLTAQVIKQ